MIQSVKYLSKVFGVIWNNVGEHAESWILSNGTFFIYKFCSQNKYPFCKDFGIQCYDHFSKMLFRPKLPQVPISDNAAWQEILCLTNNVSFLS